MHRDCTPGGRGGSGVGAGGRGGSGVGAGVGGVGAGVGGVGAGVGGAGVGGVGVGLSPPLTIHPIHHLKERSTTTVSTNAPTHLVNTEYIILLFVIR